MTNPASLFSPLTVRKTTFRNRIGVSPMCMYSATDGLANDFHFQHVASRVLGGAGLFVMEATGVTPDGRISPACLGLWNDAQIAPLQRITDFARAQGAVIGIQLAHAGRKGSTRVPHQGRGQVPVAEGGWIPVAPSAIPFTAGDVTPRALTTDDIEQLVEGFVAAAVRAVRAGFQLIEIHGAHGYLLHQFLSPLSNHRTDAYGGSLENRAKLIVDIAREVRAAVPADIVLAARLSCVDWDDAGLTIADTTAVSTWLKEAGVDLIDCSSGFVTDNARVPFAPGFQVEFSRAIRNDAHIATAAVGMIADPQQADDIIRARDADFVFLARAFLRDAQWGLRAALALGVEPPVPLQYLRGFDMKK